MVNIKVPINLKGAIKIDTTEIDNRLQVDKSARNDLQFLKNLHDTGKFLLVNEASTASASMSLIRPANGSTFYLLGATIRLNVTAGTDINAFSLESTSTTPTLDTVLFSGVGQFTHHFAVNTFAVRGNDSNTIIINFQEGADVTSSANTTIWGYVENSVITP